MKDYREPQGAAPAVRFDDRAGGASRHLPVLVRPPPGACFDQDLPASASPSALALAAPRALAPSSRAAPRRCTGWRHWVTSVALGVALGCAVVLAAAWR